MPLDTPAVDLTLYDADAQAIIDRALQAVATRFPEWEPLESDLAVVLIEAIATEVVETVYAINRIPGAVLEGVLELNGFTRREGVEPVGAAAFTVTSSVTETVVPPGTRLAYRESTYVTTAELVIPAGETEGSVAIVGVGVDSGADDGTPAGTPLDLVDTVSGVKSVAVSTTIAGGALPEDDETFLARATAGLARLNATLVTPSQILSAALDFPGVARATVRDRWNATYAVPGYPVTGRTEDGHVSIGVIGPNGAPVPAATAEALKAAIQAQAISILTVHVVPVAPQAVDVTAAVVRDAAYTDAQVQASIAAALAEYLNPSAWEWAGFVYANDLIAVIDKAEGVVRVDTLSLPKATDPRFQQLGGAYPLPKVGALAITTTPYDSPFKIAPRTI